jgi:hypothetical protein
MNYKIDIYNVASNLSIQVKIYDINKNLLYKFSANQGMPISKELNNLQAGYYYIEIYEFYENSKHISTTPYKFKISK